MKRFLIAIAILLIFAQGFILGAYTAIRNTAVSRAVNRAEQQKVQRACTARENVRR